MTVDNIKSTIAQYALGAKNAIEIGFNGTELHGRGDYRGILWLQLMRWSYLNDVIVPAQFLNDNINKCTDYRGNPEKRYRFVSEILNALVVAVEQGKVAIRLAPFSLFNSTRGS
jgi:N-ethylmaleimide reductase